MVTVRELRNHAEGDLRKVQDPQQMLNNNTHMEVMYIRWTKSIVYFLLYCFGN